MTQLTEMLGMQRSILAELRRTREAVERIEQLLAAKPRDRSEPPRWPAAFTGPLWACANSMHLHRSEEEAEACPDYKGPRRA